MPLHHQSDEEEEAVWVSTPDLSISLSEAWLLQEDGDCVIWMECEDGPLSCGKQEGADQEMSLSETKVLQTLSEGPHRPSERSLFSQAWKMRAHCTSQTISCRVSSGSASPCVEVPTSYVPPVDCEARPSPGSWLVQMLLAHHLPTQLSLLWLSSTASSLSLRLGRQSEDLGHELAPGEESVSQGLPTAHASLHPAFALSQTHSASALDRM